MYDIEVLQAYSATDLARKIVKKFYSNEELCLIGSKPELNKRLGDKLDAIHGNA